MIITYVRRNEVLVSYTGMHNGERYIHRLNCSKFGEQGPDSKLEGDGEEFDSYEAAQQRAVELDYLIPSPLGGSQQHD